MEAKKKSMKTVNYNAELVAGMCAMLMVCVVRVDAAQLCCILSLEQHVMQSLLEQSDTADTADMVSAGAGIVLV